MGLPLPRARPRRLVRRAARLAALVAPPGRAHGGERHKTAAAVAAAHRGLARAKLRRQPARRSLRVSEGMNCTSPSSSPVATLMAAKRQHAPRVLKTSALTHPSRRHRHGRGTPASGHRPTAPGASHSTSASRPARRTPGTRSRSRRAAWGGHWGAGRWALRPAAWTSKTPDGNGDLTAWLTASPFALDFPVGSRSRHERGRDRGSLIADRTFPLCKTAEPMSSFFLHSAKGAGCRCPTSRRWDAGFRAREI